MISASEWRAYNEGVREVSQGAEGEVVRRLLAWRELNPAATAAECREAAKLVFGEVVQSYDSVASSFAAEWYDYRAEQAGARLRQAVTSTVYSPKTADEVARYQARKLAKGDFEGFARACGEYAANDVLRSLNATVMANAERDRREGVRFARVPTGWETCTFCLMLASRGAVYHTRKTAGEFKHFHRRCDCKVVPGFEDDPMAELVEGYKPKELYDLWKRFKDVDSDKSLDSDHKMALKQSILNLSAAKHNPSTNYRSKNLVLTGLSDGDIRKLQKRNHLEWESYVQMAKSGHEFALLPEQGNASANIDMYMLFDGVFHYWDMKTVEAGISALKKRMTDCYRKWVKLTKDGAIVPRSVIPSLLDNPRAVVDNRYSRLTDEEAKRQITKSMTHLSNSGPFEFNQSILILKDGSVELVEA